MKILMKIIEKAPKQKSNVGLGGCLRAAAGGLGRACERRDSQAPEHPPAADQQAKACSATGPGE